MRLLDLFCGAGGAAMGYLRAGFDEIVGIDIRPQPNYPFKFIQADVTELQWTQHGPSVRFNKVNPTRFHLIHASPPCQAYSQASAPWNSRLGPAIDRNADLLPATRDVLVASGTPWIIENVPGAPMDNYVVLCGLSFGLGVRRHRWFETSFPVFALPCVGHTQDFVIVFGGGVRGRGHQTGRTQNGTGGPIIRRSTLPLEVGQKAMGIDWMNRHELSEAIPPAYTEYLGHQFLDQLART